MNYASYTRASYWEKSQEFIAIDVDISVTKLGLENVLEIVQSFTEFIYRIKQTEVNNDKFREIELIQSIKYFY